MRFSITSLVLLVGVVGATYDFTSPLTELIGGYKIKPKDHQTSRPGWASLWSVTLNEQDFGVFFWPPKYCHAIYICVVSNGLYDGNKEFGDFQCENQYIKYYPHIGELYFMDKKGGTEAKHFHQHYSIHFQLTSTPEEYSFRVQAAKHDAFQSWSEAQKTLTELKWSLKDSHLLILTNSRMCEVNKANLMFHAIFDDNTIPNHAAIWPKWLSSHSASFHTAALATYRTPSTKKVDVLKYLTNAQKYKYTNTDMGVISQRCNSYEKVGVGGTTKPVFESSPLVSVASYMMKRSTDTSSGGFALKFELSVSNCQWLRIWASTTEMDTYSTVDPKDTLDIFFNEGFFVSPDEDQAKPLPDSRQMDKIKLLFYPDPTTPSTNEAPLGEFVFGNHDSTYLFRQQFYSKKFGGQTQWFHVIKAPMCESNIMATNPYAISQGTNELPNLLLVDQCKFGRFVESKS